MKFITENDLRAQYKQSVFTDYCLKENTRLTPGARQFLTDWRIGIIEEGTPCSSQRNSEVDPMNNLLHIKIRMLENLILTTANDFLPDNSCFVQDLVQLHARVSALHSFGADHSKRGRETENRDEKDEPVPFFELTAFHLHAVNSTKILCLHRLLCAVEEFACFLDQHKTSAASPLISQEIKDIYRKISQLLTIADGGEYDPKK